MLAKLPESFVFQSRVCAGMGSPMYGELLLHCATQLRQADPQAPLVRVLEDWQGDVAKDFAALRLLGAVHALVLAGEVPALAKHYPSVGGTPKFPELWNEFVSVIEVFEDVVRDALASPPQTNEVNRSASLLPGFLVIAEKYGLPLRLREIGSSAGLNLHFDRHRYELGPYRWGSEEAPLTLRTDWQGSEPPLGAALSVESRAACDPAPIDITTREGRIRLESFFWPDQTERLTRLRSAIVIANANPVWVERAVASEWLPRELSGGWPEGTTGVVFHSSVWTYLSETERTSIAATMERAGARASAHNPLAWLRAEDVPNGLELRLTTWPGGTEERLARIHPHGAFVHWRPSASGPL